MSIWSGLPNVTRKQDFKMSLNSYFIEINISRFLSTNRLLYISISAFPVLHSSYEVLKIIRGKLYDLFRRLGYFSLSSRLLAINLT